MNTIPATLINLDRATARRVSIEEQLASQSFEWQRFSAIDGTERYDEFIDFVDQEAFNRNIGRKILPGEIGVYFSHMRVWEAFLETDEDILLVLEDDVVFHDDFEFVINEAILAKEKWDFLKLNKIRAKHPICQEKIGKYRLNAYLGPATGLGAYLINRRTIIKLLPNLLPIKRPIDHELDRIFEHDFRHFGIEPFPSHVDDGGESTITGSNFSIVRKRAWYARLPSLLSRGSNLLRKTLYLYSKGQLTRKP